MPSDQNRSEWARITRELTAEEAATFLSCELGRRRPTPRRWWAYAAAVGVPLFLPAVSVVETWPLVSCLVMLIVVGVLAFSGARHAA